MPIVDENGVLVGSFSASDIKSCLQNDLLPALWNPLENLMKASKDYWNRGDSLFVCKNGDSLESIIDTVITNHIHRVFMVDEAGKPTNVLSLSDIIREIISV